MSAGSRRLILWAPFVLLLAFEFYLSSLSVVPRVRLLRLPYGDKLGHALYFFAMGALAVRAARFGHGWSRARTLVAVVLGAIAYGTLDEWHQSFVPERDVEAADVVADTVGAFLAALVAERLWVALRLERPRPGAY